MMVQGVYTSGLQVIESIYIYTRMLEWGYCFIDAKISLGNTVVRFGFFHSKCSVLCIEPFSARKYQLSTKLNDERSNARPS
jgi:hypothetical protein